MVDLKTRDGVFMPYRLFMLLLDCPYAFPIPRIPNFDGLVYTRTNDYLAFMVEFRLNHLLFVPTEAIDELAIGSIHHPNHVVLASSDEHVAFGMPPYEINVA